MPRSRLLRPSKWQQLIKVIDSIHLAKNNGKHYGQLYDKHYGQLYDKQYVHI